jgi:hypothetical protein
MTAPPCADERSNIALPRLDREEDKPLYTTFKHGSAKSGNLISDREVDRFCLSGINWRRRFPDNDEIAITLSKDGNPTLHFESKGKSNAARPIYRHPLRAGPRGRRRDRRSSLLRLYRHAADLPLTLTVSGHRLTYEENTMIHRLPPR